MQLYETGLPTRLSHCHYTRICSPPVQKLLYLSLAVSLIGAGDGCHFRERHGLCAGYYVDPLVTEMRRNFQCWKRDISGSCCRCHHLHFCPLSQSSNGDCPAWQVVITDIASSKFQSHMKSFCFSVIWISKGCYYPAVFSRSLVHWTKQEFVLGGAWSHMCDR